MKHIKIYENFTPLFRKLSLSDAKNLYQSRGGYEEFTESEIQRIKEVMKDRGELLPSVVTYYHDGRKDFAGGTGFDIGKVKYEVNWRNQRDKSKSCRIEINKGKDEYFYIRVESMYTKSMMEWYECDTIDGLIECLKKLIYN